MSENPSLQETYEQMRKAAKRMEDVSQQVIEVAAKSDDEAAPTETQPTTIATKNLTIYKKIGARIKNFAIETAALTLLISWGFWICRSQLLIFWNWRIWIAVLLLATFAVVSLIQASIPTRFSREQLQKIFCAAEESDIARFEKLIGSAFAEREGRFLLIVEISISIISANMIITSIPKL